MVAAQWSRMPGRRLHRLLFFSHSTKCDFLSPRFTIRGARRTLPVELHTQNTPRFSPPSMAAAAAAATAQYHPLILTEEQVEEDEATRQSPTPPPPSSSPPPVSFERPFRFPKKGQQLEMCKVVDTGFVVLCEGALPGERLVARITKKKGSFAEGRKALEPRRFLHSQAACSYAAKGVRGGGQFVKDSKVSREHVQDLKNAVDKSSVAAPYYMDSDIDVSEDDIPSRMDDDSDAGSDAAIDSDIEKHDCTWPEDVDSESEGEGEEIITPGAVLRGIQADALCSRKPRKGQGTMAKQVFGSSLDDEDTDEEDGVVPTHKQRSLRVGIIGAVNAGKSSLANMMVGVKVSAVSRKRNTTLSEILGVMTKGNTQILLYDTPGLVLDILGRPSKTDTRRRSESAWQLFSHCEVLLVLVDAYRQIQRADKRVLRLVEKLGMEENPHPKRVLILNKVDIVERKKDLLPLAQLFEKLPAYESIFMVSAFTGSGVKDIVSYLMDQAVLRPWEEDPDPFNEEAIKTLSMEVVREHLLDRIHEEIPYELDHQLIDWQELEDGSVRIEQHFYLPKKGQCRIVVGKGGSTIRQIGMKACEELKQLVGRKVHLFLEVKHGAV